MSTETEWRKTQIVYRLRLDLKTLEFLKILGAKGAHGKDDKAAARTLIEQGIRQAIKDEFLSSRDVAQVQGK
jgi:hypothetical protein